MSYAAIGMGAQAFGGALQSIAAMKASQRMGETAQREQQNQQRYRNQAFGTWQPALKEQGVEAAREGIAQGSADRQAFYQQVAQSPLGLGPQGTTRGNDQYTLLGRNRANLGGYSDWQLEQAIKSIRLQDELNKTANFAGGDASVFPYKMYDAQHSQDQLAFIGSLISSLGGGAANFGQFSQAPPMSGGGGGVSGGVDANQNYGLNFGGQV